MTATEALRQFMNIKNEYILRITGMVLIPDKDMQDLLDLPNRCRTGILDLLETRERNYLMCPHCVFFYRCSSCTYGRNNIICRRRGSRYQRITDLVYSAIGSHSFTRIPGLAEELENILSNWKKERT